MIRSKDVDSGEKFPGRGKISGPAPHPEIATFVAGISRTVVYTPLNAL
jgi:hypothetical protein